MKFNSLFIHGFGIFDESIPAEDRLFHFRPRGINVVVGKNERGKTTLMEALLDTLYGIPYRRRNLRRPWSSEQIFAADVEFEINSQVFTVFRDFSTHRVKLNRIGNGESQLLFSGNANPQGRSRQPREFRRILEEIGVPSRDVMDQLAFVKKMEMESGVSDEIRRLVTGGSGANYVNIIENLKNKYFEITRKDPWEAHDKINPRLLENLYFQKEELKAQLQQLKENHTDVLRAEEDLKHLEKEIKKSEKKLEEVEFVRKSFADVIDVSRRLQQVNEKLAMYLEKKERIENNREKASQLRNKLSSKFKVFDNFEHDVISLCRDLSRIKDQLSEVDRQSEEKQRTIDRMREQRDRMEKEIEQKYPLIYNLPADFPDQLKRYYDIQAECKDDLEFYNQKTSKIKELENQLSEKGEVTDLPDDFDRTVISLMEKKKQAQMEKSHLEIQIKRRKNLENALENAREAISSNFPRMEELTEDTVYRVREYLSALKEREEKKKELEKKKKKIDSLDRRIWSIDNAAVLLGAIVVAILLGYNPKDLFTTILWGVVGLLIGGTIIWLRLRDKIDKKGKLETEVDMIKQKIEQPLPSTGIPEDFPGIKNIEDFPQRWKDYQAAVHNLEKIEIQLEEMESLEKLEKQAEQVEKQLNEEMENLNLRTDDNLADILRRFNSVQKIRDKINTEKEVLKDKFPSIGEDSFPEVPREIRNKTIWIEQFENKYPVVRQIDSFDEIEDEFKRMFSDREEIRNIESKIEYNLESDVILKEIENLVSNRRVVLEKLNPIVEVMGDDSDVIEQNFREYQKTVEQLQEVEKTLAGLEDFDSVQEEVRYLTGEGVILERRRNELLSLAPSIGSFSLDNPEEADLRLQELDHQAEEIRDQLENKKERRNLLRLKLEHYVYPQQDPSQLEEEIERLSQRIHRMEILRDAHRSAVDTLREAVEEFQKTYRKELQEDISETFKSIAGNKYVGVSMDTDFEVRVDSRIRRNIEKDSLSSGTRDQLYFAVRLALAERLSQQVSLPFLLDDPFVFFDKNRLDTAHRFLKEISKNHQIILFTHDRSQATWGKVVCDLDEIMG